MRHGAGAWLWNTKTSPSEWSGYMSSDFCEYFAGEWANDKPNGTQKQENPDFTRTGNVVNGLWDGVVMHEEYDEYESVLERYPITFHNGKVEVLRIKADHGALTDYVISEEVTTGEEYLVLSSSYPDGNYGVDGFTD